MNLRAIVLCLCAAMGTAEAQNPATPPAQSHFHGRRVADYMRHTGAPWLIRATREKEENTSLLLKSLRIQPGWTVCDLGCGNGYHSLKMARLVGPEGKIYGVDIQKQMLRMLEKRAAEAGIQNVVPVLGKVHDPNLKPESCDMILLVDVYHEMSHPRAMLRKMREALKPTGRLVLVEFRAEDAEVPIKLLHKMSKRQMIREVCPSGFRVVRQFNDLPWQHVLFFEKTKLRDLKVLFVGSNCVAENNLPAVVGGLAEAQGRKMKVRQIAPDKTPLARHAAGKRVAEALESFRPDVVVLQETARQIHEDDLKTYRAVAALHEAADKIGAKTIVMMPWPDPDRPHMLQRIKRTCHRLGDRFGVQVAPVGEVFASVERKDRQAALQAPEGYPAPTARGTYLAACTLYATISGRDPRGRPAAGLEVPAAVRRELQGAAW
ncbi:MAG: class I SAM-dependent methyltransferase, partial [Phycisphaeraceae bacterium]|nr:class I SAM-dependent methyltransferase [Phycisphaeraceae bacterium]